MLKEMNQISADGRLSNTQSPSWIPFAVDAMLCKEKEMKTILYS